MEETAREDYDSPWKEIIERFFERFMAFYFQRAHKLIAWDKDFEFLDKELQKITREAEQGRRTVDKLVRVHLKKGGEMWVLIHIEVQGQRDREFAKRVFVCNCRIFDRYDLPVASLVILSDPHTGWHPDEFGYSVFGSEMKLRFPVVKLLDFGKNESQLRRSDNPFAIVTLAHLKAIETRRSPNARMKAKLELIRLLRERKEMRRDVIDLLRFIDWELILPQNMELELRETLEKEDKEMGKPYVSSWERMAMKQGHIMGTVETLRANITEILEIRFGSLPAEIAKILAGIIDAEILQELHRQAVKCESLDAFAEHLPATV
ncbi:MAG: hypothetical protein ACREA2_13855 [Blastocatellia bacterium]